LSDISYFTLFMKCCGLLPKVRYSAYSPSSGGRSALHFGMIISG